MKKFKIVTLGCRTNQYESQAYHDQLKSMGFDAGDEDADICIVNTCTVTESADSSSRHAIRQLQRENPNAKIIVTGCFAENKPKEAAALGPHVQIVSNKDKERLLNLALPEEEIPEFKIENFEAHTRAFVKVQDGCNSFCTYCIIPYVRGRSRSRKREEIISEMEGLIGNGFQEIVITGINVGDYDGGGGDTLADLIRAADRLPGLKRLRVSSIDPDEVNDDLLDVIVNGKNTCASMHIVLQSGSNQVLKRMNRKYTRQIFLSTCDRLKAARPDFTFTTDIIVGFPGETEHDFEETVEVMNEIKFAKVHMFPYSERKRTRAALFTGKIPHEIIKTRKAKVLEISERIAYELRDGYVGQSRSVLLENNMSGHTDNFLPVIIPGEKLESNQIVNVKFIKNTPEGLLGQIIS